MFYIAENTLERHPNMQKPETEKDALLVSIEKWTLICAYYENGGEEFLEDGGISTCGCCILFFNLNGKAQCKNCPIFNKTGKQFCYDTPYDGYAEVADNCKIFNDAGEEGEYSFDVEEALKYAKAELKFLKDLFKELYPND